MSALNINYLFSFWIFHYYKISTKNISFVEDSISNTVLIIDTIVDIYLSDVH